jgi:membrane protein GlpM
MGTLFVQCLLGAFTVLVLALLAKSKSFVIAGLVPLFPTFALIAHYMVGTQKTMEALRGTALFGLGALLPYAGYLLAVYWLSYKFSLPWILALAAGIWMVLALVLLWVWPR